MRKISFVIVVISLLGCGCTNSAFIRDYRLYDSGEPNSIAEMCKIEDKSHILYSSEWEFTHSSEYYKDGHLKSEEWSSGGRPQSKLTFYESGRMKSEERFINDKLVYGIYYSEDGKIEQTTGKLINWFIREK
jgi:antitoxin component YwqK of YwqJK toxin-antitoxin module